MKLFEVVDRHTILFSMANKVINQGHLLRFDVVQHADSFMLSRVHSGDVATINHLPAANPVPGISTADRYNIRYFRSGRVEHIESCILAAPDFGLLNIFRMDDGSWMLSDRRKDQFALDESALPHFDSLVVSMIKKHLDQAKRINIHVGDQIGEIKDIDYWTAEKMLNIQYLKPSPDGGYPIRRDFRYRPLTPKFFDDNFTIVKLKGIPTLIKQKSNEDPGSTTD